MVAFAVRTSVAGGFPLEWSPSLTSTSASKNSGLAPAYRPAFSHRLCVNIWIHYYQYLGTELLGDSYSRNQISNRLLDETAVRYVFLLAGYFNADLSKNEFVV